MNLRLAGSSVTLCALIAACLWLLLRDTAPQYARVERVLAGGSQTKARRRAIPQRAELSLVSGRIHDEAGAAVAFATVCAESLDRTTWTVAKPPLCTTATDTGAYELASDAKPFLRISASAEGREPGSYGSPLRSGDTHRDIDIVLRAGGARLAGEVVDALGGTVAGALVHIEHEADGLNAGTAEADDSGRFSISAPAKTRLRVTANAEGYAPAQAVWIAPATGVRLVLSPASSIAGRVVLAGTVEPVPGVTVRAHEVGHLTDHEDLLDVSDAEGNFRIQGLYAGRHELTVRSDGFRSRVAAVDVGLAKHVGNTVIEVDPAVIVRGDAVIAATGQPCALGSVVLFDATKPPGPQPMRMPHEGAHLSSDGTFELRAVLPGRYHAQADCADHVAIDKAFEITVADEDIEGLRFRFEAGKRVRIETKNSAGEPIADAWVVLKRTPRDPGKRPGWAGVTNHEGWIELGGLEAGAYEAAAVKLPSTPRQRVELHETDREKTVTLISGGDAYITVRVQGDPEALDNRLEAHALPQQDPGQQAFRYPISGEPLGGGDFEIGPLVAGAYEVFVSDPDNPSLQIEGPEGSIVRVAAGQKLSLDARLRSHAGVVRGRVVDGAGAPVRDAWVRARFSGRRQLPLLPDVRHVQGETRILTDADGRFEIGRLDPEADFTVTVERPDDGMAVTRDGVRPGQDVTIELVDSASRPGAAVDG